MSGCNLKALTALLAVFNSRDVEAARPPTHPDLTSTIHGRGPFAGTHHGIDDGVDVPWVIRTAVGDTMTAAPEVVLAGGDHVVAYPAGTASIGATRSDQRHRRLAVIRPRWDRLPA